MKTPIYSLLLLICLLPAVVLANDDFQKATQAFAAGDTQTALKLFLSLEKQSPKSSPQLTLNIALLYLKSRQYSLANQYFSQLSSHPKWAMLARYQQGVIAHMQGNGSLAIQLLTQVSELANNAGLKEKASRALTQLQTSSARPASAAKTMDSKSLSYYLSLTSGYEDNALALPSEQLGSELQAEDRFEELFVQAQFQASKQLEVNSYLSSRNYSQYSDLTTAVANLGLEYDFLFLEKPRSASLDISQIWADGNPIYQQWQGQLASEFSVLKQSWNASFSAQQILAEEEFDFLDGYQIKLTLDKDWPLRSHTLSTKYDYEINQRRDLSSENEFSSFSPHRHKLSLLDEYRVDHKVTVTAGVQVTSSQWQGTNVILDTEDNLNRVTRSAEQYRYSLGAIYDITPRLEASIQYEYLSNHENIDENSFNNSQWMLTLAYQN